jgi:ribosomal protein S18 acetylase RimI-like enzyme
MYALRAARDDDAPRLAELLSIGQKEPVTAETIRNWRQTQSPERIATCLVATDRDGRVVGYGQAVRDPWLPPADFFLYGVVDPATRRRGIGSLLFDAVVRFAHEHGASILRCEVQEANPNRLRYQARPVLFAAQGIVIFWPVIKRAWCEARNTISSATSSGLPT